MPLFTKRPPTAEAVRYEGDPAVFPAGFPTVAAVDAEAGTVRLDAGEFQLVAASGDWVVRAEWGGFITMSDAAFRAAYMPAPPPG